MAENAQPSEEEAAGNGPTMDQISAGLMLGQSKSSGESFVGFSELETPKEGKNKMVLVCQLCRCRVIRPGYATLVEKEIFMPSVTEKQEIGKDPSGDKLSSQWLVVDMFHFENVGFSKTVNNSEKYLVCADCEMGPIGWTDIGNKSEIYVAAERVDYADS